jgi:hypothetical protein
VQTDGRGAGARASADEAGIRWGENGAVPKRERVDPEVLHRQAQVAVLSGDLACAAGAEPLEYEGLHERYLPEVTFRGRVEHRSSQYALYAAACLRGGLRPDLLNDAGWWQTPLWQYAVFAVVIYARAAAERLTVPAEEVARRIAARHDLELGSAGRPPPRSSPGRAPAVVGGVDRVVRDGL